MIDTTFFLNINAKSNVLHFTVLVERSAKGNIFDQITC